MSDGVEPAADAWFDMPVDFEPYYFRRLEIVEVISGDRPAPNPELHCGAMMCPVDHQRFTQGEVR